jgi:hypothetical protein
MSNCISYSGWTGTTGLDIIIHRNLFFGENIEIHFEIDIDYISETIPFPLIHKDKFKYTIPINENTRIIHIPQILLVPGCGINIIDTGRTMVDYEIYDNVHQVHYCGKFTSFNDLRVGFYNFL